MKHLMVYEIFNSDDIYDVNVDLDRKTSSVRNLNGEQIGLYRYIRLSFITKNDVRYSVFLKIDDNGESKMDFCTSDIKFNPDSDKNSMIDLINVHDSIKVFKTLKSIIYKYKIKTLLISAPYDRLKFYKKLLDYFKIRYDVKYKSLIAYIDDKYTKKDTGETPVFRKFY